LRLREGCTIEICDGAGGVAPAEIAGIDKLGALVRLLSSSVVEPRADWEWTVAVACGSLKGGRADWLVEKVAELGAVALIPLVTERSPFIGSSSSSSRGRGEKESTNTLVGRQARWARVATAAMKQCLRPRNLLILPPSSVEEVCELCASADVALVGVEGARPAREVTATERSTCVSRQGQPRKGVLIIGPEGDFTEEEVKKMTESGVVGVGLGPFRLRTETAAVALLSFASCAFGSSP